MGILKKKIKHYSKYIVEIEEEELQSSNLDNIEDIVIVNKNTYEKELQKSRELKAKLESNRLEIKLKDLKLQERDIELQKALSEREELEELNQSKISDLESNYETQIEQLQLQIDNKGEELLKLEEENKKIKNDLQLENSSKIERLKEEENLKKQIEMYKVSTVGLKNQNKIKEDELQKFKSTYENILKIKSEQENELESLKIQLKRLNNLQSEHNKLINNYRHLQEVANKKDENIIELEAQKRKLDHYLLMSLEAINTLKNLGLFNRLFNRIPEDIDELQEDIKKLQPPREVEIEMEPEIEPIRVKKPSDILGEKE
ncbi:MAG: hypothetical protein ACPK7O_00285 [Methanobacterium sp.]